LRGEAEVPADLLLADELRREPLGRQEAPGDPAKEAAA